MIMGRSLATWKGVVAPPIAATELWPSVTLPRIFTDENKKREKKTKKSREFFQLAVVEEAHQKQQLMMMMMMMPQEEEEREFQLVGWVGMHGLVVAQM
jgi:hypothetical protein